MDHPVQPGGRRAKLGLGLAVLCMLLFSLLPIPQGLTRAGMQSAGIFLCAILLWVTEALPLSLIHI